MKVDRLIILIFLLTLLVACNEVFEPPVENVEPFHVIEGYISTQPGSHYIFITQSRSYNERPFAKGVSGAIVQVRSESGSRVYFDDMGNGVYKCILDETNVAEVGETYTLNVTMQTGERYTSTPQTVVPSPELKKVDCEYDQRSLLTENSYGDVYEVSFGGIVIELETDGILPSNNYYMYKYVGYEQHHTYFQYSSAFGISYYNIYRHRGLSSRYANTIHTANADEFNDFKLRNDVLLFIAEEDMRHYNPIVPDSFTILSTNFEGLVFKLEQLSISPDVYTFYHDIENLLAAEGRLFDPAASRVRGNITCVSDTTREVVGVFAATDVDIYYSYFHLRTSDHIFSAELDSMPELWLDTCSWQKPESWISPPF